MSRPPHTSMDVGEIHVEGHWKRSPENDAAMAELAKAAAATMKERAKNGCCPGCGSRRGVVEEPGD